MSRSAVVPLALSLLTLALAAGPVRADTTRTLTGTITSTRPDWVYLPIDVPAGTARIEVAYAYDRLDGANTLDIGIFDQAGFRGWSGGARSGFSLSASEATPGYRPGPIRPGRWRIALGPYAVAPAGLAYAVTVTFVSGPAGRAFVPSPAPERIEGRGSGWYRGDLHSHSVHSDGKYTLAENARAARRAGLDFLVSTEHNTDSANAHLGPLARRDLLLVGGEEVTTRGGHWGAVGLPAGTWIDWRYRPQDAGNALARELRRVRQAGGLAVANHPKAPCGACEWTFGFAGLDAIEVWNGPWDVFDDGAVALWDAELRRGRTPTAVGASDAHRDPNVIGLPQTVVGAASLSRQALVRALRAGRAYVAESDAVGLDFAAAAGGRRAETGGTLPGRSARVALTVRGAPGAVATFHTEDGKVATRRIAGRRATVAVTVARARWVRAEVRRPAGPLVALTNPIRFGGR